jgi:hypothetical protein
VTRGRVARRAAIAVAVLAFAAVSLVVARWLAADSSERSKVERLLRAQVRGDAAAMAGELGDCDAACRARLRRLADRLGRGPRADLEIVRYDSPTAHALGAQTAPTRVVWQPAGGLTTVQCVLVRRTGSVLTGPRVTLLRLSEPIGREASC